MLLLQAKLRSNILTSLLQLARINQRLCHNIFKAKKLKLNTVTPPPLNLKGMKRLLQNVPTAVAKYQSFIVSFSFLLLFFIFGCHFVKVTSSRPVFSDNLWLQFRLILQSGFFLHASEQSAVVYYNLTFRFFYFWRSFLSFLFN